MLEDSLKDTIKRSEGFKESFPVTKVGRGGCGLEETSSGRHMAVGREGFLVIVTLTGFGIT